MVLQRTFFQTILLLIFTTILSTAVMADYCLYTTTSTSSYVAQCIDAEENLPITPFSTASPETCSEIGGTWKTGSSTDQNIPDGDCRTGCCCGENGGSRVTLEQACLIPDTFTSGTYTSNQCTASCNPTVKYDFYGKVIDEEGNSLAGIIVTIDTPSNEYITSADGTFSVINYQTGTLLITATGDCKKIIHYSLTQDVLPSAPVEITLDCEEVPTEVCDPVWVFSDIGIDCGEQYQDTTTIKPGSSCSNNDLSYTNYYDGDPAPKRNLPYRFCQEEPANCGNNQTEPGEDCEGSNVQGKKCSDYGYVNDNQAVKCTSCKIDTSHCQQVCPPTGSRICTAEQCANPLCDSVCSAICSQADCLATTITFKEENIILPIGTANVELSWSVPQECSKKVTTYTVESCTGKSCGEDDVTFKKIINPLFDEKENFYEINDVGQSLFKGHDPLVEQTDYCFRISAFIQEAGQSATIATSFVCKPTGSSACMQPGVTTTCNEAKTHVMECGSGNILVPKSECKDSVCYQTPTEAFCADTSVCKNCNGLYGMYAFLSKTTNKVFEVPFNEEPTNCNNPEIYQYPSANKNYQPLCYEARTQTSVDKLNTCANIQTCYDYTTERACEQDECRQELQCTWKELLDLGAQTGLGICTPPLTSIEQSQCSRCTTDKTILPTCTEDLCELYQITDDNSQNCLFSQATNTPAGDCLSKQEASCQNYLTAEQCEGNQKYTIKVQYNPEPGYEKFRIGGTHVTSPSKDEFGFGACQWVSNTCIKNADNYYPTAEKPRDDCYITLDDYPFCNRDFQAPTTDLFLRDGAEDAFLDEYPVYSIKNLFEPVASDNYFARKDLQTYFGLRLGTDDLNYPELEGFEVLTAKLSDSNTVDGTYTISYYSIDPSKNLELVNNNIIILDKTAPQLIKITNGNLNVINSKEETISNAIQKIEDPFEIQPDVHRTNVLFTYAVTDVHGPLSCQVELSTFTISSFAGDRNFAGVISGSQLENNYFALPDDSYTFKINCNDHPSLNNIEVYTTDLFKIDADKSINESQPFNERYNNQEVIQLSIRTQNTVDRCYYYPLGSPLTAAIDFKKDNNLKIHTASFDSHAEGAYYFNTGCLFENGKTKEGSGSDAIIFSIDNSDPTTQVIDETTGTIYAPEFYTASQILSFNPEDNNQELILHSLINGELTSFFDGNARIAETRYCINTEETATTGCSWIVWDGNSFTILPEEQGEMQHLHYYSTDAVGNVEATNHKPLFVRNLDVEVAGVIICGDDETCDENPTIQKLLKK